MEQITRRESVNALKEIAYRAKQGTSFDPEKRGEMLLNDCERDLQAYLSKLPVEVHAHFEERYIELYKHWLASSSRCISSFITGAANFPVRRAEKLNRWERSAREKLDTWAERFVKRVCNPTQHRLKGWDEIARLQDKLEKLQALQDIMKQANAVIRKKSLADVEKVDELVALGISEKNTMELLGEPQYSFMRKGFQPYQLSNNLARIKDTEGRIKRITSMVNQQDREIKLEGVTVALCYADERIRLYFDEKPDRDMINNLKHAAFKWSPSNSAWQRQITSNALYATKKLLGVEKL